MIEDPVEAFATPAERTARLVELRNLKMARSAHAYVRGSTKQFYAWLETTRSAGRIPDGPPVWICGDCHIGNIGPISNVAGEIDIQIRDLDQTVIGNPAHDLIRLGLSLTMSIRSSDLPGVTTALMIEKLMVGYEHALKYPRSKINVLRPEAVAVVMRDALRRRWRHLANERIENTEPTIPLGKRFWKVSDQEMRAIADLFAKKEITDLLTGVWSRHDDAKVTVVDQACWIKGCSSLGLLRFAVLVRIGRKRSKAAQHCLVDVKQAVSAIAPRNADAGMPGDDAIRVMTGAQHLSPHLGERMATARLLGRSVFIRELFPQDLKLELDQLSREEVGEVAQYLAWIVGRAHARQLDKKARLAWLKVLRDRRKIDFDAPSWLWSSIVELAGLHETGYLEHCRTFSLQSARAKSAERADD